MRKFLPLLAATLALTISASAGFADNGKAMTWKAYKVPPNAGVRVGCYNICNAFNGDTSTKAKLPILCIVPGDIPVPPAYQAYALAERPNDWQFYMGWSGGKVGLTPPIEGYKITSRAKADKWCKKQLRTPRARMATHHDNGSGGWSLGAMVHANSWNAAALKREGKLKFWTAINDQPANPWDP